MQDALTLLLQSAGFDVRGYRSAETFLAEADCSEPICLLTDVRLPDMDGIALYRHLVRLGLAPAAVVITAHGDIPMAVAALKEGVVDFVEKPFDPAMLLDSIRDASQRAVAIQAQKAHVADIEARRTHSDSTRGGGSCVVGRRNSEQGDSGEARDEHTYGRAPPRAHHGEDGRPIPLPADQATDVAFEPVAPSNAGVVRSGRTKPVSTANRAMIFLNVSLLMRDRRGSPEAERDSRIRYCAPALP